LNFVSWRREERHLIVGGYKEERGIDESMMLENGLDLFFAA
jgi:hypothetical protein